MSRLYTKITIVFGFDNMLPLIWCVAKAYGVRCGKTSISEARNIGGATVSAPAM
jgi:hypothetical protein